MSKTKMTKAMLPAGTDEKLADNLMKVYQAFDDGQPKFVTEEIEEGTGVYKRRETENNKVLRHELMKAAIQPLIERVKLMKTSITTGSNFTPYDLQAPSRHLVPWLSPIRGSLPRSKRASAGLTAHWKTVIPQAGSYTRGGMPASPWVNNGQRAPEISVAARDVSVSYVTIGKDGSVQFEAESASGGFEDALAVGHFFTLETLMVSEEDSLLGGNKTLLLGQTNTPAVAISGSGSFSGTFYVACVGLTYEGYRNFVLQNGLDSSTGLPLAATGPGLTQQMGITTGDGKTMTVNSGSGKPSAISSALSPSSSVTATASVTAKTGELAWLWYIGTANAASSLYLVACTTVPSYSFTAAPAATGQLFSALQAVDFSVNDGTTGGGQNQVTAYDGLITQALNNTTLTPQNAYTLKMNGGLLTTSGRGNVDQIDTMLSTLWNLYKVTIDVIYVNAQELQNITSRVLNGSSAPLLRINKDANSSEYDLTGSGVISFYFNPFIPGGKKIPIMVHPTMPPGTILFYAKDLPPFYKTSDTPIVAEVLTRKDYYSQEYAITTREYQFGTYCESALAVYAPFCLGLITGVGNG